MECKSVPVANGHTIQTFNLHGKQAVDRWYFKADHFSEFMQVGQPHASPQGISPATGDGLTTNRRRPILMLSADILPGLNDTIMPTGRCNTHRKRSSSAHVRPVMHLLCRRIYFHRSRATP